VIYQISYAKSGGGGDWGVLSELLRGVSSPQSEAATKLIENHSNVVFDICNPSPKTQTDLKRVSISSLEEVDQMMLEVARRLLGQPPVKGRAGMSWPAAAAYLTKRTQSADQQCPGRSRDMSEQAAAAFLTVVKQVADGA